MRLRLASLSVLLVALGAAPARASIGSPSSVTPSGRLVQDLSVAAGGGRSALLLSTYRAATTAGKRDPALYARLGNGTKLGGLKRLQSGVALAEVAVGPEGTAVAAWTIATKGGTDLRVAVASPGKAFGKAQTISHARSIVLGGVAVTSKGRAVVVWMHRTSAHPVQAATREPGHGFGKASKLGTTTYRPAVAAVPGGAVVVAWLTNTEGPPPPPAPYTPTPALMLATTLAPGARAFAPATTLASLSTWFSGPEATGGPGGAAVSWRQSGVEKRVAFVGSAGAFGPAEPLAVPFPGAGEGRPDDLALGIPSSGPTMALWHDVGGGLKVKTSVVNASRRPAGGAFQPATRLSSTRRLAGQPRAAATKDRILSAWGEAGGGSSTRVCIKVGTATKVSAESKCRQAKLLDESTVDVAASGAYGLVTWIQGRSRAGGGLAAMVTWQK